jgi:CRP/FNR family transcriptional regulator, anaerobic regulatory protein
MKVIALVLAGGEGRQLRPLTARRPKPGPGSLETAFAVHRPDAQEQVRRFEADCAACAARASCLPGGLPRADLRKAQSIVYVRRPVKQSESLFVAGGESDAVYAVWRGAFKTTLVDGDGREQVTGFFIPGDLVGMDALGNGRHSDTAVALEDSQVCVMPYVLVDAMARELPALQHRLHAALSREIVHTHRSMIVLGSMRAEQRMARFLLNLSRSYLRRGLSAVDLRLPMSRGDIGSYLGLTVETVSRALAALRRDGFLDVRQRQVRILDAAGLESVLQKA